MCMFILMRCVCSASDESSESGDHSVSLCHSCVCHYVVSARSGASSHQLDWDLLVSTKQEDKSYNIGLVLRAH